MHDALQRSPVGALLSLLCKFYKAQAVAVCKLLISNCLPIDIQLLAFKLFA